MIMEIISIFLGIFLLGSAGYGRGDDVFKPYQLYYWFRYLIDVPSVIILLVFTVPVLFKGGAWKDFVRAWKLLRKDYTCHLSELRRTLDVVEMMQKQVIYAGVIGMLMSVIIIMGQLSSPAQLGPNLAVAILTMMYAVIFEMMLLPLQLEVKRRIIDYIGEDTDAESERVSIGKESEKVTAEIETGNGAVREECENVAVGKESGNVAVGEEIENVVVGEERENVTTGEEIGNITVEKKGENVTVGKEKTVIVIQIESGKDVTVKVDEAAGKGIKETAAGTEEGRV